MQAELKHPETGETIFVEVSGISFDELNDKYKPVLNDSQLKRNIENLEVPAEAKLLLYKMKEITIKIGNNVLHIGIKIIESALYLIKEYKNTTTGVIIGALIGLLFSSIPIFGWLFGWILLPLCTAFGLAIGFWTDMKDQSLKSKIKTEVIDYFKEFSSMKVQAA